MADPVYVRARAALLDAAEALEAHRDALVLVGAQAVYRAGCRRHSRPQRITPL